MIGVPLVGPAHFPSCFGESRYKREPISKAELSAADTAVFLADRRQSCTHTARNLRSSTVKGAFGSVGEREGRCAQHTGDDTASMHSAHTAEVIIQRDLLRQREDLSLSRVCDMCDRGPAAGIPRSSRLFSQRFRSLAVQELKIVGRRKETPTMETLRPSSPPRASPVRLNGGSALPIPQVFQLSERGFSSVMHRLRFYAL